MNKVTRIVKAWQQMIFLACKGTAVGLVMLCLPERSKWFKSLYFKFNIIEAEFNDKCSEIDALTDN